jgi:hypothetical protein
MTEMHRPIWVQVDPTGGDPVIGGPVTIVVCDICGQEQRGYPAPHLEEVE